MQSSRFSTLAIAGVMLALPASLPAATTAHHAGDRSRAIVSVRTGHDSLRAAAALAAAERYAVAGRTADARRQYRSALDEQVADGACTSATLWSLANTHFADGDELAAARTLDAAAVAAAECADPEMELRATFEATMLYALHGRRDLIGSRVARIQRLLRSPAIPADVKAGFQRRMSEK